MFKIKKIIKWVNKESIDMFIQRFFLFLKSVSLIIEKTRVLFICYVLVVLMNHPAFGVLGEEPDWHARDMFANTCTAIMFLIPVLMGLMYLIKLARSGTFSSLKSKTYQRKALKNTLKIRTLFSQVAGSEGFTEIPSDEHSGLHEKLVKGPYALDILNSFPYPGFTLVFKREKPDHAMYLCYTYEYYAFILLSNTAVHPENLIIKNNVDAQEIKNKTETAFGPGVNLAVIPLSANKQDITLPNAVREIITRNDGIYPVGKELRFIFAGKGGICVAVRESGNNQDVANLLRFSRDLAGLLEESQPLADKS